MVNPGHASKGCISCKLRKVRCDLSRPFCQRCRDSGRVCLGFREKQANRQTSRPHISPSRGEDDEHREIEALIKPALSIEAMFTSESYSDNSLDSAIPQGSGEAAAHVMDTIRRCLHSLRQPSQSPEKRRALIAEYGAATSELRTALAVSPHSLDLQSVGSSVLLFSMYEVYSSTVLQHLSQLLIPHADDCQYRPSGPDLASPS